MSLRVSLLSLITGASESPEQIRDKLEKMLRDISGTDIVLENFVSSKELFISFARQLADSQVIFVTVEPEQYDYAKTVFMKALSMQGVESAESKQAYLNAGNHFFKEADRRFLFPVGAQVYASKDGLNSAFTVSRGEQTIIFAALDRERINSVMKNGFFDFVKNLLLPESKKKNLIPAQLGKNAAVVAATLCRQGVSVAVAECGQAALVRKCLSKSENASAAFSFCVPDSVEGAGENINGFVAVAAKKAREKCGATIGAAISNIYSGNYDKEDVFCVIAVTDGDNAHVVRVYAENGESARQTAYAAINRLLRLILDYAKDPASFVNPDRLPVQETAPEEGVRVTRSVAPVVISAILLGIAVIASGVAVLLLN